MATSRVLCASLSYVHELLFEKVQGHGRIFHTLSLGLRRERKRGGGERGAASIQPATASEAAILSAPLYG